MDTGKYELTRSLLRVNNDNYKSRPIIYGSVYCQFYFCNNTVLLAEGT